MIAVPIMEDGMVSIDPIQGDPSTKEEEGQDGDDDEKVSLETAPLLSNDASVSRYEAIRADLSQSEDSPTRGGGSRTALVLFALFSFIQSSVFVDWNPIENSVLAAFKTWSETTISFQASMATIPAPIVQGPLWIILQRFKLSTVIKWMGMLPLLLATLVRVLPLFTMDNPEYTFTVLVFISSFIVGVVGVLFYSSLSKFSLGYFGSSSTTLPTGVAMMASNVGVVFASVIGPFAVDDPVNAPKEQEMLQGEIRNYLLLYAILVGVLTIVMIFTFPEPIHAEQSRLAPMNIMENFSRVLADRNIVFLLIVNALSSVPIYWSSTFLPIYFARYKFGQEIIGVLMGTSVGLSIVETLLSSKLVEAGKVRPWTMIVILLFLQVISSLLMSLFLTEALPPVKFLIGSFFVISNSLALSLGPHIIPYGAHLGENISGEILNGVFHQTSSIFGGFFLFIFAVDTHRDWVPYSLTICPFLAFGLCLLVRNIGR
eukprot:TRINITY_DN4811_c0_g1_i1.p1 TRINITY_DN4811_c0_g1~~TRINITY_DN4811_c0_g1_i1.p1  ORF type:complete len:486 (-),score=70.78 TRINITY_DN4811_c0_g1_i1:56-1513(-)